MGLLFNSCKKENDGSYINSLITSGVWRLASVRTELLHGDTTKLRDTLNTDCSRLQVFTFKTDGSCTYDNFHCIQQATNGTWRLTTAMNVNTTVVSTNLADSVFLSSNMVCKDTSKAGSSRPFARVRVTNLGQNSLVLENIKTDTVYRTPVVVLRRLITRYGFIH